MRKRFGVKSVVALVVSVILLTSLVNYGVWSNPGSSEIPIDQYSFSGLDDYIIVKVTANSEYRAIDGDTGETAYTSTGLVAAIQWAHDQLTNGGSIGLRYDDYYTNKEWEQKLTLSNNGIFLHGMSVKAGSTTCWIRAKDNLDDDMILNTGLKNRVSMLSLDGNKANQASGRGIFDDGGGSSDFHLDNVYIFSTKDNGIHWNGGAGFAEAVYVEYCDGQGWLISNLRNVFLQCGGYANAKAGFVITADRNKLFGCIAADQSGTYGDGFVLQNSDLTQLVGCESRGNNRYGILMYGATKCKVDAIVVNNGNNGVHLLTYGASTYSHNNTLSGQIHDNGNYGICEADANQDHNIIDGCHVSGHSTAEVSLQGSNSTAIDCILDGKLTENSGIATNLADGNTITHGLAGTPDMVMLTCLNATYGTPAQPVIVSWNQTATDSTNIGVNIYWTNSTAISDSVIDVSWYAEYNP